MSKNARMPSAGFDELSINDEIENVELLWNLIAADETKVPVAPWQREILDERLAELEADPDSVVPWGKVFDRVSREIGFEDPSE